MRIKLSKLLFIFVFIIYWIIKGYNTVNNDSEISNTFKINSYNNTIISKASNYDKNDNDFLAKISIPKIGLSRFLYNINSNMNSVSKNIEVLKDSAMPDVVNGNFILAAHSGYSSIAFFHNLNKLKIGDKVIIYYKNKEYVYVISKIYDVMKTGSVSIIRDKNKSTITMITCKESDKQLVVIGYLI